VRWEVESEINSSARARRVEKLTRSEVAPFRRSTQGVVARVTSHESSCPLTYRASLTIEDKASGHFAIPILLLNGTGAAALKGLREFGCEPRPWPRLAGQGGAGGSRAGSYSDPRGPSAAAEVFRQFG